MPSKFELTLQQLAQIALGTPHLTQFNVTILHTLIDVILKKLNCQNESVSIGGYESKCLEKLLERAKISSLPVNDEKCEVFAEKFLRLDEMEERLNRMENKLERHFEEIKKSNQTQDHKAFYLNMDNWEHYSQPLEDLCTTCDPENEIACDLIKNADFMKKLMRRIATPMVERMLVFETKIAELHKELAEFIERTAKQYESILLIEGCIMEVERLRKEIDNNSIIFISTMEEVQDMLDAKVDKVHMPALKKFIKDNITRMKGDIELLQKRSDCPKAAGIIIDTGLQCLSCGSHKVGAKTGIQATPLLPDAHVTARKKHKKPVKHCGCFGARVNTTGEPTLNDRLYQLYRKQSTGNRFSHKVPDIQLLLGSDGSFYRSS